MTERVTRTPTESRHAIWRKYARVNNGAPVRCTPGKREIAQRGWTVPTGSDGKVIYNDRESALAAAREFEQAGLRPMTTYPCDRSKHGHYHLTTEGHQ